MFKDSWRFTLSILLLMFAALGVGGYVALKVNDFSYGTKIKVPGWLEFETQFIKGIEQQKLMKSSSLVLSSPIIFPPVITTDWDHNETL
jgi:hypothetical protein